MSETVKSGFSKLFPHSSKRPADVADAAEVSELEADFEPVIAEPKPTENSENTEKESKKMNKSALAIEYDYFKSRLENDPDLFKAIADYVDAHRPKEPETITLYTYDGQKKFYTAEGKADLLKAHDGFIKPELFEDHVFNKDDVVFNDKGEPISFKAQSAPSDR